VHNGFSVEFVWKSISFDRMQASALPQQRQRTTCRPCAVPE
jgi:hypothetical protein